MTDTLKPNGGGKRKINVAMGVSLAVSIIGLTMGWGLLAQSWAKDTRYELLQQQIEYAAATSSRNESLNHEHEILLKELTRITERLIANQEAMQKQLDRIERKVSP